MKRAMADMALALVLATAGDAWADATTLHVWKLGLLTETNIGWMQCGAVSETRALHARPRSISFSIPISRPGAEVSGAQQRGKAASTLLPSN